MEGKHWFREADCINLSTEIIKRTMTHNWKCPFDEPFMYTFLWNSIFNIKSCNGSISTDADATQQSFWHFNETSFSIYSCFCFLFLSASAYALHALHFALAIRCYSELYEYSLDRQLFFPAKRRQNFFSIFCANALIHLTNYNFCRH